MRALVATQVFDGTQMHANHAVLVEAGHVAALCPTAELPPRMAAQTLPRGWILAPGYVDLQVNGGGGVLFNDATNAAGLAAIAAAHRGLGTTAILPTLISGSRTRISAALAAVAAPPAGILGVHLEGPHLAIARRGIHPATAIRPMLEADLAQLRPPRVGHLLVTLAPETLPAGALARLVATGAVVFAGHSEADWDDMVAARAQGLRGSTHLFNAMRQIGPRAPGLVGATLGMDALFAGIILDGQHVHPANARLAFRLLGPERLFVVSDAMPSVGGPEHFLLDGVPIGLREGRLTDAAGTLAGAHLCLAEAVRNAVDLCDVPVAAALRMATATPAAAIGAGDVGRLGAGARADMIALDPRLVVRRVWQGGAEVTCDKM